MICDMASECVMDAEYFVEFFNSFGNIRISQCRTVNCHTEDDSFSFYT